MSLPDPIAIESAVEYLFNERDELPFDGLAVVREVDGLVVLTLAEAVTDTDDDPAGIEIRLTSDNARRLANRLARLVSAS